MPKIDLDAHEQTNSTGYPPPFNEPVAERWQRKVAEAGGLTELGARHVVLKPGAWSSQRHWHEAEDEFLIMLEGEAALVEDEGETLLKAGDCAVFLKNIPNGHHLINRSGAPAKFLVVGAKGVKGNCHYPDVDLAVGPSMNYTHKDGTPWSYG
jgi:uncharacterized cupin superfamily protein